MEHETMKGSERCTRDVVLSIGLNVGKVEPLNQLEDTIYGVSTCLWQLNVYKKGVTYVGASQWEGVPERFIQVRHIAAGWPWDRIRCEVAMLARQLQQQCISVSFGESWILVAQDGTCTEGGSLIDFPIFV